MTAPSRPTDPIPGDLAPASKPSSAGSPFPLPTPEAFAATYFYAALGFFLIGLVYVQFEVLQLDFSGMYAAGMAVKRGLSPYDNWAILYPDVWDGQAPHWYSRWIYPPLAAWLYVPFTWLPYTLAKWLWTLLVLGTTTTAIVIFLKEMRLELDRFWVHVVAGTILWSPPLFASVERGQIDSTLLVIILCGLRLLYGKRPPIATFWAGVLLALATFIKVHCGLLLFFILLRGYWRAAIGFAGGLLAIILLSCALIGVKDTVNYYRVQVPRISLTGPFNEPDYELPQFAAELAKAEHMSRTDLSSKWQFPYYVKNYFGHDYVSGGETYTVSASVAFPIRTIFSSDEPGVKPIEYQVITFWMVVILAGVLGLQELFRGSLFQRRDVGEEWVFWVLGLTSILLVAPFTWVMTQIWLVLMLPVILYVMRQKGVAGTTILFWLVAGVIITMAPDFHGRARFSLYYLTLALFKPQIGTICSFVGLMLYCYRRIPADEPIEERKPAESLTAV